MAAPGRYRFHRRDPPAPPLANSKSSLARTICQLEVGAPMAGEAPSKSKRLANGMSYKSFIEDWLRAPVPPFSAVGQPSRAPQPQPGDNSLRGPCDSDRVSDIACRTYWDA